MLIIVVIYVDLIGDVHVWLNSREVGPGSHYPKRKVQGMFTVR